MSDNLKFMLNSNRKYSAVYTQKTFRVTAHFSNKIAQNIHTEAPNKCNFLQKSSTPFLLMILNAIFSDELFFIRQFQKY